VEQRETMWNKEKQCGTKRNNVEQRETKWNKEKQCGTEDITTINEFKPVINFPYINDEILNFLINHEKYEIDYKTNFEIVHAFHKIVKNKHGSLIKIAIQFSPFWIF